MKFEQIYSSSASNFYIVTAESGERLLIECGNIWKKLEAQLNYNLLDIVGCLLTHEHKDHAKAAEQVRKAGIKILCSEGTANALGFRYPQAIGDADSKKTCWHLKQHVGIVHTDLHCCTYHRPPFQFISFSTIHDAEDPCGFVIYCDDEYMLFATDTAYIEPVFRYPFSIIAIECSYDKNILQNNLDKGTINEEVAKRLLNSHQEKSVCLRYLKKFCNLSKCREIHLLHMSSTNINKRQVAAEFEKELFMKVIVK